jgi:tetratricopeptide (TPR) repeat protein
MKNLVRHLNNNKKRYFTFVMIAFGCGILFRGLYPRQDIGAQINRLREETAPQLDSFSKSLAVQSNFKAYIQHLILSRDDLPLAQRLIDSVLQKNPKNEYFLVLKGQVYDAKMRYDSALFEYDLAMQRDAFPYALEERAKTFIKLGKYNLAICDYRNAFDRNFDYSYSLAVLFDRLHQKDSALKYYSIFIKHYPNSAIEERIRLLAK